MQRHVVMVTEKIARVTMSETGLIESGTVRSIS